MTTSRFRRVAILCAAALPLLAAAAAEPDLGTPRRALRRFLDAAGEGDYRQAARVLDLGAIPEERRAEAGPRLARQIQVALEARPWIDWNRISDEAEGDPADGPGSDVVARIPVDGATVPVRLVRQPDGSWLLGPAVVAAAARLHARWGPGWIAERLPPGLVEVTFLGLPAWHWIGLAAAAVLSFLFGVVLGALLRGIGLRLARRTRFAWDDRLIEAASGPGRMLLALAAFAAAERALRLAPVPQSVVDHLLRSLTVVALAWAALRAVGLVADLVGERLRQEGTADGAVRARMTQVMVLRRVAGFVVLALGGALVLLQFDGLRAIGTSLLASAGVAGIVIGLAAQRSIATLLAGLQITFTQPVRVGDVVVIEGEWGTIEEITLTYAVVRVWDLRRLVVPLTRILDAPFQNWTRTGSDIIGTVFLHADYRVPLEAVRKELDAFVRTRKEWDGKVVVLQVTDATDRTVQLRALVSSADSPRNWDLRCAVRERLVAFLQQLDGGRYLPRTRLEPSSGGEAREVLAPAGEVARGERRA